MHFGKLVPSPYSRMEDGVLVLLICATFMPVILRYSQDYYGTSSLHRAKDADKCKDRVRKADSKAYGAHTSIIVICTELRRSIHIKWHTTLIDLRRPPAQSHAALASIAIRRSAPTILVCRTHCNSARALAMRVRNIHNHPRDVCTLFTCSVCHELITFTFYALRLIGLSSTYRAPSPWRRTRCRTLHWHFLKEWLHLRRTARMQRNVIRYGACFGSTFVPVRQTSTLD